MKEKGWRRSTLRYGANQPESETKERILKWMNERNERLVFNSSEFFQVKQVKPDFSLFMSSS